MLRFSIVRTVVQTSASVTRRSFAAVATKMGAGDTGAPRPRGSLDGKDEFTRREAAQEALYVYNREMEKIKRLKEKLREQRRHLDELGKHIDEVTKEQGGEQG